MRRNKFVITLLVFVLALGCVVVLMRKQAAQTWRLPDGSELSLAKVSYGKNHEMNYGNGWKDYVYPVLPTDWRSKLHCKVTYVTTTHDAFVIWFWQTNLGQAPGWPRSVEPPPFQVLKVEKNGEESGWATHSRGHYGSLPGADLSFWSFPTQSREITIRIYSGTNRETRG